ncbi:MAG: restriction endonuclease subunit S [Proteobacteria bacterium]|nr:restriction endonuclease subunit S [Pseudomonadota bacterium]
MKQDWEIKKLGDVCDIFNGLWKGKKPPFIEVGVIRNTNFTKEGCLDDSDIAYLPVEIKQYEKRKLEFGDIILEKSGGGPKQPVGRVVLFGKKEGEFSFSNFTSTIRIINRKVLDFNYLHRFLFFEYISGKTESMQRQSTGIRNLQLKEYKEITVPLPSLPEQKRIVAILDKAFAAIAKAKANAEQNLKNAKELFESYLQGVFEDKGEGWEEKALKEICELKSGTTISPSLERDCGDVLYTKVADMNLPENLVEINTSSRFVNSDEIKQNQIIPEGAIIFPKRGGAIATNKKRKIIKPTIVDLNTMAIIPGKKIEKDYFYHWFQLFDLNEISNGANIPQINNYSFDEIYVPYPVSLKEQKFIVKKLNALSAKTKKLEAIYQKKIEDLEELKKSVLQKAFNGEL